VLKHFFEIKQATNKLLKIIKDFNPDKIISFDSPGLAKFIVKKLRKDGYNGKIYHVVAPSVWFYKEGRAKVFAKYFDKIMCILPFETPYFTKYGLDAVFVGNPVVDNYSDVNYTQREIKNIGITIGSRHCEVHRHIKIVSQYIKEMELLYPNIRFTIPSLPHLSDIIRNNIKSSNVEILSSHDAMNIAMQKVDFFIAKSGTNALEIAIKGIPHLVYYKLNWVTFWIINCIKKMPYVNLINILSKRFVIPELIQGNFTVKNLISESKKFIENENARFEQCKSFKMAIKSMQLASLNSFHHLKVLEAFVTKYV
jgi:lipid-A-disaccharide synthase